MTSPVVPPPAPPVLPPLATVQLAAVSKAANLVLVNFKGDCNGLRARLYDQATRRFYGFEEASPCQEPAYAAPSNLYTGLIARALGGQVKVYELLQSAVGQRLSTSEQIGDCRASHLQVQDEYVGRPLEFITAKGCTQVGLANDADLPTRMVAHYVAWGVEPIVAAEPYSPSLTRCDKTADPSTLAGVLAGLTYRDAATLDSAWQVVCLKPGTYAGPFKLKNANHLMLVAAPGTVTLKTDLPISSTVVGAPFELWYSSNIVVRGIQFENAHQFAYVVTPTLNEQYAVGFYVAYVAGLHVSDIKVATGGKEAVWLTGTSFARLRNADITGAYFALTLQAAGLLGDNVKITTRHPIEPADEHSMIWLGGQQAVMKDTTLVRTTGRGLASGQSTPETDVIFFKNVTALTPGLDAWFQQHYNYSGLQMVLSGIYPRDTVDYFINLYGGGGVSTGMSLVKQ